MNNYHICPMCGNERYYDNYNYQQFNDPSQYEYHDLRQPIVHHQILLQEIPQLKGKQIQVNIQDIGPVIACVGPYNPATNRVELQNIKHYHTGMNYGNMNFLLTELTGYKVIAETCSSTESPTTPSTGGIPSTTEIPESQLSKTTVLRKTITSFGIPTPVWNDPFKTRTYGAWLEVTVPVIIAQQSQNILDRCMNVATESLAVSLAPFLTPVTYAGLPGAIPAALGRAVQAFSTCIASNPIIYPYLNRIKLNVNYGWMD